MGIGIFALARLDVAAPKQPSAISYELDGHVRKDTLNLAYSRGYPAHSVVLESLDDPPFDPSTERMRLKIIETFERSGLKVVNSGR